MKNSQKELIGFLRRFAAAFTDGGDPPSVRGIRKPKRPVLDEPCILNLGSSKKMWLLFHGADWRPSVGQEVVINDANRVIVSGVLGRA